MDRRLLLPFALMSLGLSDGFALIHSAQAAQIEPSQTKTHLQLSQDNRVGATQGHVPGCTCPICSRTTPVVEP